MSLGQILGGVVGGIIGFVYGGPMGAVIGFGLGMTLGGFIDPYTPDIPQPGVPNPETQVMQGSIGGVISDFVGTVKITGHLLAYGKERNVEVTETQESSGGKGGGGDSQTYVTGYKYYMTWVLGLCVGPVNTLYAIYAGEELIWEGELNLADAVNGEETLALPNGSCTFYFGTDDQVANPIVGELTDDTLNSPYRGFCWALLDDYMIGKYPRTPTLKFMVTKQPEFAFSAHNVIQEYDYNPIHAIWYVLYSLVGLPSSWLNETSFAQAASIVADEYRGVSVLFNEEKTALSYLEVINMHMDNVLMYGSDGTFYPKLIRKDYDVATIPSIDESLMLDDPTFNRGSWTETVNEMKVQYTELTAVREKILYGFLWGTGGNGVHGLLAIGDNSGYKTSLTRSVATITIDSFSADSQLLVISEEGLLYGCGYPYWYTWGQNNDPGYSLTLVDSMSSKLWKAVSAGSVCSMAIDNLNNLYATGLNIYGELGNGTGNDIEGWTLVNSGSWKYININYNNSFAIGNDSTLWGAGSMASLGLHTLSGTAYSFTQLGVHVDDPPGISSGWTKCVGSINGSIGLKGSIIYTTGYDVWGNIGQGHDEPGVNYTEWTALTGMWSDVFACFDNYGFFALNSGQDLYYSGKNGYGQGGFGHTNVINGLTLVPGLPGIQDVAVSINSCAVLDVDGYIWSTGINNLGNLGQGDTLNRTSFEKISNDKYVKICRHHTGFFATKL